MLLSLAQRLVALALRLESLDEAVLFLQLGLQGGHFGRGSTQVGIVLGIERLEHGLGLGNVLLVALFHHVHFLLATPQRLLRGSRLFSYDTRKYLNRPSRALITRLPCSVNLASSLSVSSFF